MLKKLRIANYLRELSIIIVGIAVTLYVSDKIAEIKLKKDLNLQVNAIMLEMESNLSNLDDILAFYYDLEKLQSPLIKNVDNLSKIHPDTLDKYAGIAGQIKMFIYKQGAYEMLKNTGAMKLFDNKQFIMDVTDCYTRLQAARESNEMYMNLKLSIINRLIYESKDVSKIMYRMDFEGTGRPLLNFMVLASVQKNDAVEAKKLIENFLKLYGDNKSIR